MTKTPPSKNKKFKKNKIEFNLVTHAQPWVGGSSFFIIIFLNFKFFIFFFFFWGGGALFQLKVWGIHYKLSGSSMGVCVFFLLIF
jgi:hypothetical protein